MKQIGTDYEGWPIYIYTLREILHELGFKEDTKTISLEKDKNTNKLLDSYPLTLQDDGMAYGVNPQFIVEIDKDVYKNEEFNLNVFNLFRYEYRPND